MGFARARSFLKEAIFILSMTRPLSVYMIGKIVRDDGGHWITSMMGMFAKDVSDCCAATAYLITHEDEGVPQYIYDRKLDLPFDDEKIALSEINSQYRQGKEPETVFEMEEYKEKFKEDIRKQIQGLGLRLAEKRVRN
jgi:hypothetical protein